jgi:hypothetical protein
MASLPRPVTGVLSLLLAAALVRGPLHAVTFGLPVSNDDAILLLMARHVLQGELATTLWNQPYNGALDAYLLAPFVALFGHHHAFRLYEAVCAALLALLAGLLAGRIAGPRAGWAAALLAAWGTPYMALMTATGPPPNFLMPLVTGFPLWVGLRGLEARTAPIGPLAAFGVAVVCGLAVWNSSLAVPAFLGMAAGLLAAGLRPRWATVGAASAGLGLGASPLVLARWIGASGSSVVTAASAVTAIRPRWLWWSGLRDLGQASWSFFGFRVPLVVDGPEKASLPAWAVLALALGLGAAVAAGAVRSRRSLPLLGWALALAGAFALSRRTSADELRYLYGLGAPVFALAGIGLARLFDARVALGVGAGLLMLVPWGLGDRVLAGVWRNPGHAVSVWQVPPIEPALQALGRAGVESAYASLQFAGRITLESGGAVVASQAWNERIPGDPLRFRDEVDLDPGAAWVLSPTLSRGMPRAARFRELVREMGGDASEEVAGDLVVFHAFRPPFDEGRPVPAAALSVGTLGGRDLSGAVLDRDPKTAFTSPEGLHRGAGLVVRLSPARRLSAVVLVVDLVESPLAVPWVAEVQGEVVARGPARHGLQWLGGAPRAGRQAALSILLGDQEAGEVRLIFQGPGPRLVVSEVLAYGPDESERAPGGAASAKGALLAARRGHWAEALAGYREALRLEPERASHYAAEARAAWRARGRRWLDVEGIDDGGPDLVLPR